jgi:hypothetical protein
VHIDCNQVLTFQFIIGATIFDYNNANGIQHGIDDNMVLTCLVKVTSKEKLQFMRN